MHSIGRGKTVNQGTINWLTVERDIRSALRAARFKKISPYDALHEIDEVLGSQTGRGYELVYDERGRPLTNMQGREDA
jgi:hypothetical protein